MSIFREYDIRGIFEKDLNKDVVTKIGYLLGSIIKQSGDKVAIGYDARVHSPTLFEWLSIGFANANIEVYNLGMIPTPVAYFATYNTDITSSVMITGSHNPPEYNGFKITIDKKPFYGDLIQNLAKDINSVTCEDKQPIIKDSKNVLQEYIGYMCKEFSFLKSLKARIAFDCGNGVAGIALGKIIENLNLDSINLYFNPDGTFPNHHPDPSEEKNLAHLKKALKEHDIHIGIAYDGDADRVALISQRHSFKGDELAIIFAEDIAKSVEKPIIIGEVKCSQVMYDYINKIGKGVMYKTGHSNLKVKLKELNAALACEMSGHIFFNDRYFGYDDAIYASLRILEIIYKLNESKAYDTPITPLENIIFALPKTYSTDEEKIATSEDKKFKIIEKLKEKLRTESNLIVIKEIIDVDGVRVIFENGWGLVRASNTTPMLVTRFEADSKENLEIYKGFLLDMLSGIGV